MRPSANASGRVAALDLGEVRTGVALSDPSRTLASPLEVVPSAELDDFMRGLVEGEGVSEVVVGIPRTLSGELGFQAQRVLSKLHALKDEFPGVRFVEWDERFTTRMAAAVAGGNAGGAAKKKKRGTGAGGRVDHLAAARMLQEYLETRGNL